MKRFILMFSLFFYASSYSQTTLEDYNFFKNEYLTGKYSNKYFYTDSETKSFDSQTIKSRDVYSTNDEKFICVLLEETVVAGVNNTKTRVYVIPSRKSSPAVIKKCYLDFLKLLPQGDCVSDFETNRYSSLFSIMVNGIDGKYGE